MFNLMRNNLGFPRIRTPSCVKHGGGFLLNRRASCAIIRATSGRSIACVPPQGTILPAVKVYSRGKESIFMVTESVANEIANIGCVAGLVWNYLELNGPVTLTKLAKEIEAPRDLVMQGVGWLAREGKVRFDETPRSEVIALA